MSNFKRVAVIGLGYIGLPTAAVAASRGVDVIGIDVVPEVVDTINRGEIHIVEPDLDVAVKSAVGSGKLRATLKPEPADVFILAVPTPFKDGYKPDVDYVEAAARSIAPVLKAGDLVILESTSPVGTTEAICHWLASERADLSFPHQAGEDAQVRVAHCPERVLPGQVLHELIANDRVIGGMTRRCAEAARDFYKIFVMGECILTDAKTAEMAKLTENTFRDVNIAFANELSMICDDLGINVWELIALANRHPRVKILQPGCGVGGHCIAVDPWFIVDKSPALARLTRTAREVNDGKPHHVMDQVKAAAGRYKAPVIACLGLAFKPDIDDLRESPALEITKHLAADGVGKILAVEPNVKTLPKKAQGDFSLVSLEEALAQADVIVVLVKHKPFIGLSARIPAGKVLIDVVNAG
ncbi:MAG: UDP-N-acetyl-D-mannosamine dehydrogenase [Gammaproteobacteria bacterium]|nr:UDP-N-acetyl-D-mannosamine dehydrogenase [Gammaproteobacteria bacterium]